MTFVYAHEAYFARAFRNLFLYPYHSLSKLSVRALNEAAKATRAQHSNPEFHALKLTEKPMECVLFGGSFGPDVALTPRDGSEIEVVFEIKLYAKWNWTELRTCEAYAPIDTDLAREIIEHYESTYTNVFQTDAYLAWQWWGKTEHFNNAPLTRQDDAHHIILTLDGKSLSDSPSVNKEPLITDTWIPIEIREFVKTINRIADDNPGAITSDERKMVDSFTYVAYTAHRNMNIETDDEEDVLTPWKWLKSL